MPDSNDNPVPRVPEPAIILVAPQLGENIGMVARAMLNCGLTDLRLVRPRDGWPSASATAAAAGADRVLEQARLYDSVADAVADLHRVFATTARPRGMVGRVTTPARAAGELRGIAAAGHCAGLMFGGERSGLSNDDLVHADTLVRIPLNPGFTSLNLAQAVLLLGYAWFASADGTAGAALESGDSPPAAKAELDGFLNRLEQALDNSHFYRSPEMRPTVRRGLRNLFQRATPTAQEIRTLHGVLSALRPPPEA